MIAGAMALDATGRFVNAEASHVAQARDCSWANAQL
jgi:hypothetical protein